MKHLRQQKAIRIVATLALTLALAGIAIPAKAEPLLRCTASQGGPQTATPPGWCRAPTNLYGTTVSGGNTSNDVDGTVFKMSTTGAETILDNFYTEGLTGSWGALTLATNENLTGQQIHRGCPTKSLPAALSLLPRRMYCRLRHRSRRDDGARPATGTSMGQRRRWWSIRPRHNLQTYPGRRADHAAFLLRNPELGR